jgi:hypothetical protein
MTFGKRDCAPPPLRRTSSAKKSLIVIGEANRD